MSRGFHFHSLERGIDSPLDEHGLLRQSSRRSSLVVSPALSITGGWLRGPRYSRSSRGRCAFESCVWTQTHLRKFRARLLNGWDLSTAWNSSVAAMMWLDHSLTSRCQARSLRRCLEAAPPIPLASPRQGIRPRLRQARGTTPERPSRTQPSHQPRRVLSPPGRCIDRRCQHPEHQAPRMRELLRLQLSRPRPQRPDPLRQTTSSHED